MNICSNLGIIIQLFYKIKSSYQAMSTIKKHIVKNKKNPDKIQTVIYIDSNLA